MTMTKGAVTKAWVQVYRAGVVLGITAVLWFNRNYVPRDEFDLRLAVIEEQRKENLGRLLVEIADVKQSIRRVESILLNQRAEVVPPSGLIHQTNWIGPGIIELAPIGRPFPQLYLQH